VAAKNGVDQPPLQNVADGKDRLVRESA